MSAWQRRFHVCSQFAHAGLSSLSENRNKVPGAEVKTDHGAGFEEKEKIMFNPIRKIARAVRGKTVQEREFDYLNASMSQVDLEYRQREIDRGMFRR